MLSVEETEAGVHVRCPNCEGLTEVPSYALQAANISPPSAPEKLKSTAKPPELHAIKAGGRAIVLPAPDNGCRRCDHLGKPPLVPAPLMRRQLAFFVAGEATETQPRYFFVQCARFIAQMNETPQTYAKLQDAMITKYAKADMFDVTKDSVCWSSLHEAINHMIFTNCMMLVRGRVLYLHGMCHQELTGIGYEETVMQGWRDRIRKANT